MFPILLEPMNNYSRLSRLTNEILAIPSEVILFSAFLFHSYSAIIDECCGCFGCKFWWFPRLLFFKLLNKFMFTDGEWMLFDLLDFFGVILWLPMIYFACLTKCINIIKSYLIKSNIITMDALLKANSFWFWWFTYRNIVHIWDIFFSSVMSCNNQ